MELRNASHSSLFLHYLLFYAEFYKVVAYPWLSVGSRFLWLFDLVAYLFIYLSIYSSIRESMAHAEVLAGVGNNNDKN